MPLPYGAHNNLGEFANDALATANAVLKGWDIAGSPQPGMEYYNTTSNTRKYWNGAAWVSAGFGLTLDEAYDGGGAGLGRTIAADAGSVEITGTGNSPLKLIHNAGNVSLEGALDVARNQAIDLNNTVRMLNFNEVFSAVGLPAARNLQGFFNNVTFTGNLAGVNKCSIIGQVNTILISNASGRVGSGDAAGLYGAAFTFKTTYAPPALNTGYLSGWTNIESNYLHNGDSNGSTSGIIGINQALVFGGGTKYTITNVHGLLISFSSGAGAVGSIITNLYGARISAAVIGAGVTVTNNYGLRIETATGGVNNWSLYVAGGLSYFGGNVDMSNAGSLWFRPPRMTTAQRNAMTGAWGAADAGKEWYNTDTSQWEGWNGAAIVIIG